MVAIGLGAMGMGSIASKGENPFDAVGSKGLGAIDAIGSKGLGAIDAIGSKGATGFDLSSKGLNTCCFSRITNPGKKSSLFIKLIDSIDL
jgi:hypothetical protein